MASGIHFRTRNLKCVCVCGTLGVTGGLFGLLNGGGCRGLYNNVSLHDGQMNTVVTMIHRMTLTLPHIVESLYRKEHHVGSSNFESALAANYAAKLSEVTHTFFGNPVELEPVDAMHLLGFDVNLGQRTITYRLRVCVCVCQLLCRTTT